MRLYMSNKLSNDDIRYNSSLMLDYLLQHKEIGIILKNIYKIIHNQEFNLFLLIFY